MNGVRSKVNCCIIKFFFVHQPNSGHKLSQWSQTFLHNLRTRTNVVLERESEKKEKAENWNSFALKAHGFWFFPSFFQCCRARENKNHEREYKHHENVRHTRVCTSLYTLWSGHNFFEEKTFFWLFGNNSKKVMKYSQCEFHTDLFFN